MPTLLKGPATSRSATTTPPLVARLRPDTSLSSVDLPQPDGPTTATNSPLPMRSDAPSSASVPPAPPSYIRLTSEISTNGCIGACYLILRMFFSENRFPHFRNMRYG